MIKAILFDLDGVLCSCVEIHKIAFNNSLKSVVGFELTDEEHLSQFNGLPTKKKLQKLLSQGRIQEYQMDQIWNAKQEATILAIKQELKVDDTKRDMLRYLHNMDYKLACVTNSITETAGLMLTLTGQLEFLDLLVSNEMIRYPKPHPEGYINAMVKLNSLPSETIIVEDSPVGLQAAEQTGAHVWKVKDPTDVTKLNFVSYSNSLLLSKMV